MNNLINIDTKDNTITARELYEFLDLNPTNYAKWTKKNIEDNAFASKGVDWALLVPQEEYSGRGQRATDYKLTIDFAKKLCMISKSAKGEAARNYFIEVEKQLKNIIAQPMVIPQNYPDALRAIAVEYEAKLLAEAKVAELAPKAEAFDVFIGSKGYYNMNTAAKMLGTGRNRLYDKLRKSNMILSNSTDPYQHYVNMGIFTVKAWVNDYGRTGNITLVSPKGIEYIRTKLSKVG